MKKFTYSIKVEALRQAVKKWSLIVHGLGGDMGTMNCRLCYLFRIPEHYGHRCFECPVFEFTNNVECNGTPYVGWANHTDEAYDEEDILEGNHRYREDGPPEKHGWWAVCSECRKWAQKELMFLQMLLEHQKCLEDCIVEDTDQVF